jgi:hypothetical protein
MKKTSGKKAPTRVLRLPDLDFELARVAGIEASV